MSRSIGYYAIMPNQTARVDAIQIAPHAKAAMVDLRSVEAAAGCGLRGDRNWTDPTTDDAKPPRHNQVTLIEAEAVEAANRDYGLDLTALDTRRNIVTRNIALNHLVERTFLVGEVNMRGTQLCEPCGYVQRLAGKPKMREALVHRGGLRAEILTNGVISVGDEIRLG